ncbi:MAG: helix-hairpin-helix domain-containing protein [Flavobacteriaceae bacterium]|nr:helix-hairpin-helix domain-containing protein [Flavobacteriaceae bacterium]
MEVEEPDIIKIDINNASFKEILKTPYIDYELTIKTLNYKLEFAEIQSLDELKNIEGFPADKFDIICEYLKIQYICL